MQVSGGCLCGAVRYTAEIEKAELGACHCQMCRRWHGGIPIEVTVQPGGISLEGEDELSVYKSSTWAERVFCKTCGSSLYYRLTAEGPHQGLTMISAGTLDDIGQMPLTQQVYIDQKPSGYSFAEQTQDLTQAQVEEMFADM